MLPKRVYKNPFFIAFLFFITLLGGQISCNKKDKTASQTPKEEEIKLSLVNNSALPGDVIEIKLSTKASLKEVDITLNTTPLKAYIKGDSSYVFVVPVIPAGSATLAIPSFKNSNRVELTIGNYTYITDPQIVLNEYLKKRDQSIDSLIKYVSTGSQLKPSQTTLNLISQLKEEWNLQLAKLTASEKELLAYVMARNMPVPTDYTMDTLPANYYARVLSPQTDVGDRLVTTAKVFTTLVVSCVATVPGVISTGIGFLYMPIPVTAAIFLAVWTTHLILKEAAALKGQEVARMKGIVESITDVTAQRTMAVEFTNNTEKVVEMSVGYRNLVQADASLNVAFSSAFEKEQTFTNRTKEIENIFSSITNLLTKLKGSYLAHQTSIGSIPVASLVLPVAGADITIKSVSDSRITFSSSLVADKRKIKVSSTSDVDINFDLTLAYLRKLDGKEILKVVPCVFKANQMGLAIISGNNQTAPATFSLGNPLTVEVKSSDGKTISGIKILWKVVTGGGKILLNETTTDANGRSTNGWQLGASGMQTVSAEARKSDGSHLANSPVVFSATINEPATVTAVSGNNQTGSANTSLANPLTVVVKDANGTAMNGINVSWTVTAGGGQLTSSNTATNTNGIATNTWKLGASGNQTATATVKKSDGSNVTGSPVTFTASFCNNITLTVTSNGLAATASASGGTAPYTYSWNNGAVIGTVYSDRSQRRNVTVTVTDANGCTATRSDICVGRAGNFVQTPCTSQSFRFYLSGNLVATLSPGSTTYVIFAGNQAQQMVGVTTGVTHNYTSSISPGQQCLEWFTCCPDANTCSPNLCQ